MEHIEAYLLPVHVEYSRIWCPLRLKVEETLHLLRRDVTSQNFEDCVVESEWSDNSALTRIPGHL